MRAVINKTSGGLYLTAAGVLSLIDRVNNSAYLRDFNAWSVFVDQYTRLLSLKQICEASELDFFEQLHIEGSTIKERTKNLRKRVDEYNEISHIDNWLGAKANKIIDKLAPYFDKISVEELSKELTNKILNANIMDDYANLGVSDVINYLNNEFKKNNTSGRARYFIDSNKSAAGSGARNRGLQRYVFITTEKSKTTGLTDYKIEFAENTPQPIRKKVLAAIDSTRPKQAYLNVTNADFRKIVLDLAITYLNNGKIDDFLKIEIQRAKQSGYYDLTKSESSVRGFLGEIAGNATLAFLFNTPGIAIPTGSIKDFKKGSEISIDSVLNAFHFQIKNYNLKGKDTATFHQSKQAGYLVTGRAGYDAGSSIGKLLIELFGAYHYNQPFKDQDLENSTMTIAEYTDNVYRKLGMAIQGNENKTSVAESLLSRKIDEIIRLDSTFQARVNDFNLFQTEDLYLNTFFRIEGIFIPSSLIISAIIDCMKEDLNKDKKAISFNITNLAQDYHDSLGALIKEEGLQRVKKDNVTAYAMAQLVNVQYEIKINLEKVLDDALNKAIKGV